MPQGKETEPVMSTGELLSKGDSFKWEKMRSSRQNIRMGKEDNGECQCLRCGSWDFPGGPVAQIPCSQLRGPRFDPWSGN